MCSILDSDLPSPGNPSASEAHDLVYLVVLLALVVVFEQGVAMTERAAVDTVSSGSRHLG
jgi:hypothetical protein